MKHHFRVAVLTAYALGFWFTFGHAWNLLSLFHPGGDPVGLAIVSAMCSLAWPFYWSAWMWS